MPTLADPQGLWVPHWLHASRVEKLTFVHAGQTQSPGRGCAGLLPPGGRARGVRGTRPRQRGAAHPTVIGGEVGPEFDTVRQPPLAAKVVSHRQKIWQSHQSKRSKLLQIGLDSGNFWSKAIRRG